MREPPLVESLLWHLIRSFLEKAFHDWPKMSCCFLFYILIHGLILTSFISTQCWHLSNIISTLSLPGFWPLSSNWKCLLHRRSCIRQKISSVKHSFPQSFSIWTVKLESSLSVKLPTYYIICLLYFYETVLYIIFYIIHFII